MISSSVTWIIPSTYLLQTSRAKSPTVFTATPSAPVCTLSSVTTCPASRAAVMLAAPTGSTPIT